jgi:vitamin B12 transporter
LALSDQQLLTLGLYTEAEATAYYSFGAGQPEHHRVNALYAEDDLDFSDQRLVLAGRDTHDQSFGEHFTYNIDYGYDLNDSTKLTAGVGTGFRAPTAEERFDAFSGNDTLKPEDSQNLELGLRQKFGASQSLSLSVFRNKLDDLIVFDPTPVPPNYPFGRNQNVGRARVEGLEAEYQLNAGAWSWRTDAILQNPENLDNDTYLLRRARHTLSSNLDWHDDLTTAGLNLLLTGSRRDIDINTGAPVTDAGYALLGVSLHRELGAGFAGLIRVDNLLDARYQTASGYNTAGRSLFLQLEYHSR